MKIIAFLILLFSGLTLTVNSHAWWSFSFDDLQWSDRSGSVYGPGEPRVPVSMRVMQDQDFANYYLLIKFEGLKPEEIDIQRQGPRISIRQMRGSIEESESGNVYRQYQSFSSFTRRLTLPPDADPDVSKMKRENQENFIRVTIPKLVYKPWM